MAKIPSLSVVLAVRNEAGNLPRCLSSVRGLAEETVIVDGSSTDGTPETARSLGARVIETEHREMFHRNKQLAVDAARGEWILQLDADEVIPPALSNEIAETISKPDARDGYFIKRKNFFLGHWMKKGGQYPDAVIRLFKKGHGSFPALSVHEQIAITGTVGTLEHPMEHYSYVSVRQYWKKADGYIRLSAKDLSKRADFKSPATAAAYFVFHPVRTFFSLFVRHKGFMDGWYGFLFALFSAMHYPKTYLAAGKA